MISLFARILGAGVLVFVVLAGPSCPSAYAHRVNVFCEEKEGVVRGEVYFSPGRSARNVNLEVLDLTKKNRIQTIQTDREGRFEFRPAREEPLIIIYDDGMGHHAECLAGSDSNQPSKAMPDAFNVVIGLAGIAVLFGVLYFWKKSHAS